MTTTQQETILSAEGVRNAVAKFNDTDRGIAELEENYGGVLYNVDTVEGMKAAKRARKRIREPRYMVESLRKGAKAPILELGRKLDEKAKRLTGRLLAIETPIDEQIKAEEKRVEEAKRIEEERVAGHRERIERVRNEIHELLRFDPTPTPSKVRRVLDRVRAVDPAEFEEFKDEAVEVCRIARSDLESALRAAEKREQEQVELAALRREKAEREAKEKAEREEAERKARRKAREQAEREAVEKEARTPEPKPVERQRAPLFTTSGDPPELNVPYEALSTEPPPAAHEDTPEPNLCDVCGEAPVYPLDPGDTNAESLCVQCFAEAASDALDDAYLGRFCCELLIGHADDGRHYLCLSPLKGPRAVAEHCHIRAEALVECAQGLRPLPSGGSR